MYIIEPNTYQYLLHAFFWIVGWFLLSLCCVRYWVTQIYFNLPFLAHQGCSYIIYWMLIGCLSFISFPCILIIPSWREKTSRQILFKIPVLRPPCGKYVTVHVCTWYISYQNYTINNIHCIGFSIKSVGGGAVYTMYRPRVPIFPFHVVVFKNTILLWSFQPLPCWREGASLGEPCCIHMYMYMHVYEGSKGSHLHVHVQVYFLYMYCKKVYMYMYVVAFIGVICQAVDLVSELRCSKSLINPKQ